MNLLSESNESFYKESFTGLVYSGIKIQKKEFENCIFEKCTFIECVFDACQFTDCIFSNCSISAAKPYNSQFFNVIFKDSKIMGFDWTKIKTVRALTFERCDISYSNFSYVKLHGIKLIECISKEVNFNEADLTEGVFTNTDFLQSVFSNTNLTKTDFRKAINNGIDINFNILKKAKFSLPEATSLLRSLDIVLEV